MLFPSKFTCYEESIINKMTLILECRQEKNINLNNLYKNLEKSFENTDDFIFALDGLYALGLIDLDKENIQYVS